MDIVITCRQRVRSQSVGMDRGAGLDMSQKKGSQACRPQLGNNLNPAASESFGLELFHCHRDEGFASSPSAALPWPNAANHRFIHFHIAGKPSMLGMANGRAKSVKYRPSSLVGAKTKKAMESLGGHPVLRCRHVPSGREPYRKWRFCVMKEGACRCRNSAPTRFAPPPTIFQSPPRAAKTFRARKTGRPAQPIQVIEARSIIRKPAEKISVILGVVLARLRPGLHR